MARILYLGSNHPSSTSAHRARALVRLGHTVEVRDPRPAIASRVSSSLESAIHYRTGYRLLQRRMQRWTEQVVDQSNRPDLVWVNSGELLGKACLQTLKGLKCPIILYSNDDPTGNRDGRRFDSLLRALPCYDLCAVMREVNKREYQERGAQNVLRVFMSYDEEAHRPFSQVSDIPDTFRSEVAFIGTWMRHEKRDEFLLKLIQQGVPVSIWGSRWLKSPHWKALQPHHRGGALSGRDYVAAMQGAQICLGLLSKENRDLHTRRSVEVPYAGGLLCAERTSEHQAMYQEGVEAVFWSDADECARLCKELLANDSRREDIRQAGMRRVSALSAGNEDICRTILEKVGHSTKMLINK